MISPRAEEFFASQVFQDDGVLTPVVHRELSQASRRRKLDALLGRGSRMVAASLAASAVLAVGEPAHAVSRGTAPPAAIVIYSNAAAFQSAPVRTVVHRRGRRGRHTPALADWSLAPKLPATRKVAVFPRPVILRPAIPRPILDDSVE